MNQLIGLPLQATNLSENSICNSLLYYQKNIPPSLEWTDQDLATQLENWQARVKFVLTA